MSPSTATAVFGSIILALFLFDRDRKSRVSLALGRLAIDQCISDCLAMARSGARRLSGTVSRREPSRCANLRRAPGGRFGGALRERSACQDIPEQEQTSPRLSSVLRRKYSLVRLSLRGLQTMDEGRRGFDNDSGGPHGSRSHCRVKATPCALRFCVDPSLPPAHQVLPRVGAGLQPVGWNAV